MARTRSDATKRSEQNIQNASYDEEFDVLAVELLGYDGSSLQRLSADNFSLKLTEDGDVTYIALASPGSSQSSAVWQARKLDQSSGLIITWADGNSDFDNVATDLTALNYS